MEQVLVKKEEADRVFYTGNYELAYEKYDEAYLELIGYLNETEMWRMIAKGAGWLAALLTGGFGLEDLVIIPAVNSALLRIFNLDLDKLLGNLNYALRQKLACLSLSPGVSRRVEKVKALNDFLLNYRLIEHQKQQKQQLNAIFEIVNPISDNTKVYKVQSKLSGAELTDSLVRCIDISGQEVEQLNSYLFSYLEKSNSSNTPLYFKLRQKGYQSSRSW